MGDPFEGQGFLLRLLVPFLAGAAAGLAAGRALAGLVVVCCAALLGLVAFRAGTRPLAAGVMFLGGLLWAAGVRLVEPGQAAPFLSGDVVLRGIVREAKASDAGQFGVAGDAVVSSLDSTRSLRLERVFIAVRGMDAPIPPGAGIRAMGRLRVCTGRGNPGEFPREAAAVAEGVQYAFSTDRARVVFTAAPGAAGLEALAARARARARAWIEGCAGRSDGALYLLSLATGDVPPPSHPMVVLLRRTGLAHLLAVSGINVAIFHILCALALRLVLWIPLRRRGDFDIARLSAVAALPACWAYALLTGAPVSALRSAGMLTAGVLAWRRFGIRGAGWCWTVMFFATLVLSPRQILSPSFLLSYAATFFLIAGLAHGRSGTGGRKGAGFLRTVWRWAANGLRASALAFLGTLPVSCALFSHLPVLAIPWNFLFGPVLGTAGVAGAFCAVVGGAASAAFMAEPVRLAARFLTAALRALDALSAGGWGYVPLPPAGLDEGLLFTGAAAWGAAALRRRGGPPLFATAGAAGLFLVWVHLPYAALPDRGVCLTALNLGRGAAHLVSFPDGRHMVVDCGSAIHGDAGERALAPLLRSRGVRRVDLLVLTHPHEDHYGGARALLEQFAVGEIWIPAGTEPAAFGEAVARRALRARRPGDRLMLGGAEVVVHGGGSGAGRAGANAQSLVLEVRYGSVSFWLTGDAEGGPPAPGVRLRGHGRRHLLFLPHHGSPGASPAAWIEALRPDLVVSQNGNCPAAGNLVPSFRFASLGNGALSIRSDGAGWSARQERAARLLRILWRLEPVPGAGDDS